MCFVLDYKTQRAYANHHQQHDWRLIVKLRSRRALLEFMQYQGLSGRALARKAGLSPAIVGHLARDSHSKSARRTCSIKTARAIEEALGCPPGFLFEADMCSVAAHTTHREKVAA